MQFTSACYVWRLFGAISSGCKIHPQTFYFISPARNLIIVVDYLLQYTQKNLEFALTLEPKNEALLRKMEWVLRQRKQKLATVPSTIGDELEFNPFMRVDQKSLQVRSLT